MIEHGVGSQESCVGSRSPGGGLSGVGDREWGSSVRRHAPDSIPEEDGAEAQGAPTPSFQVEGLEGGGQPASDRVTSRDN